MNKDERTAHIEENDTLLTPFEKQILKGELKDMLSELITRLEEKGYVKKTEGETPKAIRNLAFNLQTTLKIAKAKKSIGIFEKSNALRLLNPTLKGSEDKAAYAKKLYDDVQDLINVQD